MIDTYIKIQREVVDTYDWSINVLLETLNNFVRENQGVVIENFRIALSEEDYRQNRFTLIISHSDTSSEE